LRLTGSSPPVWCRTWSSSSTTSAAIGPSLVGWLADRAGFAAALRAAIGGLLVSSHTAALVLSSVVIGAFVPGNVPLVLGRTQELFSDPQARQSAWRTAIVVFAVGQAASAYLMSDVFARTGGNYRVLFALATAAVGAALVIELVGDASRIRHQTSKPY
jgi:predicted MFS family arabinose efflux permease